MTRTTDVNSGLTAEMLRKVVRYDSQTGKFYWLRSNNQSAVVGGEAGTIEPKTGYIRFTVLGRKYQAHRLAWLYITGEWPSHQIDHRNLVRSDNWFDNLRQATPSNNMVNKRATKRNILGIKGVSEVSTGRFVARTGFDGKIVHIGSFDTPQAAHRAYLKKSTELHGQFARGS